MTQAVVITGASAGIGRATAQCFGARLPTPMVSRHRGDDAALRAQLERWVGDWEIPRVKIKIGESWGHAAR